MKLAEKVLKKFESRKIVKLRKDIADINSEVMSYIKDLRYGISDKRLFDIALAYLESWDDAYKSGMSGFRAEALLNNLSDKQMKDLWNSLESKFKKYRIKMGKSNDSDTSVEL